MPHDEHTPEREWALKQMQEAGAPQPIATAVKRLLDVWWTQNHTPETRDLTVSYFEKLVKGHALVADEDPEERWAQARPGAIQVRDEVRVRSDAYDNEAGMRHNGRRGVVVAIRYGDVIVDYRDGRYPELKGVHHAPGALEKRVA